MATNAQHLAAAIAQLVEHRVIDRRLLTAGSIPHLAILTQPDESLMQYQKCSALVWLGRCSAWFKRNERSPKPTKVNI